jgi:hypothetical protein
MPILDEPHPLLSSTTHAGPATLTTKGMEQVGSVAIQPTGFTTVYTPSQSRPIAE